MSDREADGTLAGEGGVEMAPRHDGAIERTGESPMRSPSAASALRGFDRSECGNGPDEHGEWPCDPQVAFGGAVAECSVCGRVARWEPGDE
jgi:hypothetical protein